MLQHYLNMAWRNLLKNKLSSFINIFGLSAALGCSIVVFLFIDSHYNQDAFHANARQIFLVEHVIAGEGQEQLWGTSPVPLGPALQVDFPQITRMARVADRTGTMRYQDKVFDERIRFVDAGFLEMFTFPFKYGDQNALSDKNALILSEATALKYFGEANPIGEQVTLVFDGVYKESFFVKGVAEKFPRNASFSFAILAAYDKQLDLGVASFNDWRALARATFIQLPVPEEITTIAAQMDRYVKLQNAADTERPMAKLVIAPLLKASLNSYQVRDGIVGRSIPPALIVSFYVMGLFGLVALTLAKRMKEFSIRKVLGASLLHLANALNKDFAGWLATAIILATPLSYFIMKALLESGYEYHITIGPSPFLLTAGFILVTTLLTVSSHVCKVVITNPVEVLRHE